MAKGGWEPEKVGGDGELLKLNKWMKDLEPFKEDILVARNIWTPRGNGPRSRYGDLADRGVVIAVRA